MAACDFCGEQYSPRYECNHCGQHHCPDCRLPEQHNCPLFVTGSSERVFESDAPSTLGKRTSEETESRGQNAEVQEPEPMGLSGQPSPSSKEPPTASSPTVSTTSNDADSTDDVVSNADETQNNSFWDRFVLAFSTLTSLLVRVVGKALRPIITIATSPLLILLIVAGLFLVAGTVGTGVAPIDDGAEAALEGVMTLTVPDGSGGAADGASADGTDDTESSSGGVLDDSLDEAAIEQAVHERVNQIRREQGLQPLDYDQQLQDIADGHSEDMAERGYFSHDAPDGSDFSDRYEAAGYDCRVSIDGSQYATGAENIAYTFADTDVRTESGTTVDYGGNETEIGYGIVRQWMNSQGHREIILRDYWQNEGIGIAVADVDGRQKVYATQNFC